MEIYLFKSTLCIAIFYAFYHWVLEKETMHTLKRFYLLGALLTSFLVPLITFTRYMDVSPTLSTLTAVERNEMPSAEMIATPDYLSIFLWAIYGLGVTFFAVKFCKNLFSITQKITQNERVQKEKLFHVLLKVPTTPHTFFNYIFVNKQKFEGNEIPQEVLLHEQVHANQRHSIDTLFIELIQIIFWFNPMLYLLKKSIKLNHEFLADQGVLQQGTDKSFYQHILLAFSSDATTPGMANSFNYSSLKKRFTVMKKNTSLKTKWLKGLMLIPLVLWVVYGFSNRALVFKPQQPSADTAIIQQEIASSSEIKEFNRLAKKYNAQPKDSRVVDLKDLKRMEDLYRKMTVAQKEASQPFPECPPSPPAPPIPPTAPIASLDPIDHLIRMAKENAVFFYEDQPISSEEAIARLKETGNLNIETVTFKNSNPIVKITSKPITTSSKPTSLPAPDPAANLIEIAKRGGIFYINGKEVSSDEAIKALRENQGSKIDIDETDPNRPVVWISGC